MSELSQGQLDAERRRRRRRVTGLVMILVSIVLVLAGQFALEPYLRENLLRFALYWGACSFFTLTALMTAVVDMILVRREAEREERRLAKLTFGNKAKSEVEDNNEDES